MSMLTDQIDLVIGIDSRHASRCSRTDTTGMRSMLGHDIILISAPPES